MKPRIRLRLRIWSCVSYHQVGRFMVARCGYGYTPASAFEDWSKQP